MVENMHEFNLCGGMHITFIQTNYDLHDDKKKQKNIKICSNQTHFLIKHKGNKQNTQYNFLSLGS